MSSGSQVDLDWAGADVAQGGAGAPAAGAAKDGAAGGAYLTDEEILGIEPPGGSVPTRHSVIPSEARNLSSIDDGNRGAQRDSSGKDGPRNDNATEGLNARHDGMQGAAASAQMPSWMQAVAADPQHGGEAQQLWREHQEFRAAFASPEEARAIKELLPGGVRDVLTLREATQSVDRIDAAIFSGDARAQSEVVAEMARANPAAFRSMFAEAARVLAGKGAQGSEGGGARVEIGNVPGGRAAMSGVAGGEAENRRRDAGATTAAAGTEHGARGTAPESPVTNRQPPVTNHESQITNHESQITNHQSPVTHRRSTGQASRRRSILRPMRASSGLPMTPWRATCAGRSGTRWRA